MSETALTLPKKKMPSQEAMNARRAEKAQAALALYFEQNEIGDFSKIPAYAKLTLLQTTPKIFIRTREINAGGKKVQLPYIDHQYAEKALNFVFNFNISCEIMEQSLETKQEKFKKYDSYTQKWGEGLRTVYSARATVRFKFFDERTQREIVRDVVSGHKGYENPATTESDTLKSAVSKAWTVVARTFGIGADISQKENEAYRKVDKAEFTPAPARAPEPQTEPVKKSFAPDIPNF